MLLTYNYCFAGEGDAAILLVKGRLPSNTGV